VHTVTVIAPQLGRAPGDATTAAISGRPTEWSASRRGLDPMTTSAVDRAIARPIFVISKPIVGSTVGVRQCCRSAPTDLKPSHDRPAHRDDHVQPVGPHRSFHLVGRSVPEGHYASIACSRKQVISCSVPEMPRTFPRQSVILDCARIFNSREPTDGPTTSEQVHTLNSQHPRRRGAFEAMPYRFAMPGT
jgi:hypothetical protein